MSARLLRRTFAAPFVVTMAGCMVQSAPPRRGPQPQPVSSTPAQDPGVVANPPHPGVQQAEPKPTHEMHWTVMKEGETCRAYVNAVCPANAICNPPPPTDYACTALGQVAQNAPVKVVRYKGSETCQIETEPMRCPPNVMCNPPPPQQVACPK